MPLTPTMLVLVASHVWGPDPSSAPLETRVPPPATYARLVLPADSFGAWLRRLPVRAGRPDVRLYDGRAKGDQSAHHLVLDLDVGARDLMQCADSIIRLRAEWQRAAGVEDEICYRFTSGHAIPWSRWRAGARPVVEGSEVRWRRTASADGSYASFRAYLDRVFMYAGTASLERGARRVADPRLVRPGDIVVQGGFPGHAALVIDVVEGPSGDRRFLLAQGFMPAQEIHVLRRPGHDSPWYPARRIGMLHTPEWSFRYDQLRRIEDDVCP